MPQNPHQYDALFYQYQREGSGRSARLLLPELTGSLAVRSVLDVGCGAGAWLAAHRALGVAETIGVDGDYVDRSLLLIDEASFVPQDITRPFDLGRQFDLVECLEVAEHVPTAASACLVDNIARHGKQVLFSAAVPGQGGEDHINEQPLEYWRDLFVERGYRLFDFVRARVRDNAAIEPWYRFNSLFFAHESVVPMLPAQVRAAELGPTEAIPDHSPLGLRLRKLALRMLPASAVSRLAVLKHRRAVRAMRAR